MIFNSRCPQKHYFDLFEEHRNPNKIFYEIIIKSFLIESATSYILSEI